MVSPTPSQIAAEQTKQRELQTYIERVAAGQDKPQTVNITYYERPHPRDPNTVIVGYRATTDQPLRFQSNYTSYETQVKAGTDYKQALEKTALQGVKAYYHLGADDTIAIQGKVVQSPTYSPQVIGIAQQVAQEKQAYDVKLASLREQQQAQLKAGITFQAEQTAKIQELQSKTAGMSPTQAADYLKGELKGYYGRDVLAGVRYTVGDKTFSDPKMAERYAAQLSQQQAPRGLPQDVLKPVFVGGKPNVELFQQTKTQAPETFYSPKYGLMTKPTAEPTLPIEQIQKEFGGINLSVISTTSRKYGEIGAEKIRKSIFDTSFLPKEIKESRGMKALYTITPLARESAARLVSFGGMVLPTTEVIGRTAISKPALIPKLVLTGAVLTAGGISESIQKEPRQFLADILVSAGTMKGLSMGTGFVVRKTPTVIKFGESVIRTQKPMMRSFLASEEAVLKPRRTVTLTQLLERPKAMEEKPVEVIKITSMEDLLARPTTQRVTSTKSVLETMGEQARWRLPYETTFEAELKKPSIKKPPKAELEKSLAVIKERGDLYPGASRWWEEQPTKPNIWTARETLSKQIQKPKIVSVLKPILTQKPLAIMIPLAMQAQIAKPVLISMSKQVAKQVARQRAKAIFISVQILKMKAPQIQAPQAITMSVLAVPTIQVPRTVVPEFLRMPTPEITRPPIEGERVFKRLPFPTLDITEEFFKRKGRKRKEKAKKGSVIAPIITPAQILRGGVLFRGSLLKRARRFK